MPTISRRGFLKTMLKGTAATGLLGVGGYTYMTRIEPGWVNIVSVPIALAGLASAFAGYRIVHISDLHADDWMTRERLDDMVSLINAQQPDLVAITGDFVTRRLPEEIRANLVGAFSQLAPGDATLAVLGNHDHWTYAAGVRDILRESGVIDISNGLVTLTRGSDVLHIGGVDDIWERQDRLDLVLAQLPTTGAAVLLAHEPDFADTSAATGRFGLQLSGHSHGGQVNLPFIGPPILPPYGEKYPRGLYQIGGMWLYTNPGVGMVRPQVRFNCRPEITVLTLTPQA